MSVVEIFETKRSRQMHVEWVGTLQDELLGRKTTKSLVGMGKKSFYFIANEENVKRSYWVRCALHQTLRIPLPTDQVSST